MIDLPCGECTAACCRSRPRMDQFAAIVMPGEVFAHRERCVDIGDGRLAIPYDAAGDCIFLDAARCSIHASKPDDCRRFDCSTHPLFQRTHPAVVALLSRNGYPLTV